jgi:hypothetical protein
MPNRRETIRCAIEGLDLSPSPGGVGRDLSETGLSWTSPHRPRLGALWVVSAPALLGLLRLPAGHAPLEVRVFDVVEVPAEVEGEPLRYRIGAAWERPTGDVVAALRRAVLRLQRPHDPGAPEDADEVVVRWPSGGG